MSEKQGPQQEPPRPDQAAQVERPVTGAAADDLDSDHATASKADDQLDVVQRSVSARGAPASLTQSDVDALIEGRIDKRLAEKFASRPLDPVDRSISDAKASFGPVSLGPDDVALVEAEGRVSRNFEERAERASLTRAPSGQGKAATTRAGTSAPKLRPEGSGEANTA